MTVASTATKGASPPGPTPREATTEVEPLGADGNDTDAGGPEVVHQEEVGTFDITVIEGGTAPEVMTWLADNGYDQGEGAEEIIAEYLAEDFAFMAVKLTANADVAEIHPIALIFDKETEACVPLKLTRIAAVDDMEVRTYFLGQNRTVPQNYKHVLVNPLKIDWMNQGSNYTEVIQRAVDADMANGRAWVTEYAGPSNIIPTTGLTFPQYNPAVFADGDAADAVNALKDQGLIACGWNPNIDDDDCIGFNPLILPILTAYVPDGVESRLFFLDPIAYRDQLDPMAFDAQELDTLLMERVIEPGKHAEQVLGASTYLSRLYTLISPHEMTEDPMFWHNATLEDVPNIRSATRRTLCNGDNLWILPDGREVYIPADTTEWPDITGEEFWEEEVADTPENGAPIVLVNNTEAIDQMLAAYNAGHNWDGSGETGESGSSGGPSENDDEGGSGGCGCDVGSPFPGALWAVGFMFGFGVLARRRRAS